MTHVPESLTSRRTMSERALADAALEPHRLEIEITESIAMEGAEIVVANLNVLR